MTVDELIRTLIEKGVKLIPQGAGVLEVDGLEDALTPELIEGLKQHKQTILRRMAAIARREPEPVGRTLDRLIDC